MTTPDYIIDSQRTRLDPRTERTGTITDVGALGTFTIGTLLTAIGTAILLVGLQILPYPSSSILAPYWVISTVGGMFCLGGITLWGFALREYLHHKRCRSLAKRQNWAQIYGDYPWNPHGVTKSPWAQVARSLIPLMVFAIFLVPFHWWGWSSNSPPVLVIVLLVLFDLIYLLGVWELIRRLLAACRYGNSRLEYGKFPFVTGQSVDLRWIPPTGLTNPENICCTLRCVEEWYEWEGMSNDRCKRLKHAQLWSATRSVTGRSALATCSRTWLRFEVPDTVPGTFLSAGEHIYFWEFEVTADVVGIDFTERYLVPVYSRS